MEVQHQFQVELVEVGQQIIQEHQLLEQQIQVVVAVAAHILHLQEDVQAVQVDLVS
jgi:hypothetical protein